MECEQLLKMEKLKEIEELIVAVHTIINKEYRSFELGNNLSFNQQLLVYFVGKQKITSVKGLAHELNISPSAVSQMIAKLEKMNILKRTVDAEDRRNICVELCSEGIAILEELEKIQSSLFNKYFSKIAYDDLCQFKQLYERFFQVIVQNSGRTNNNFNEKQ